jgi:hypothetical protein
MPRKQRIDWTKVADNELARRIGEAIDADSVRGVEEASGVARTSLMNILYGVIRGHPEMKTINALATFFKVPPWRIQEWIGIRVDLPGSGDKRAETLRISQLVAQRPELASLVEQLPDLTADEVRATRAFLEHLISQRTPHVPRRGDDEG